MVMPHNERVGRGLDAVRDGIKPVCEAAWKAAYGDGWIDEVHGRDKGVAGKPDPSDLIFLLKGMQNTWQEVWRQRLGQSERAYTSELRDFRNTWAHQGQFSTDDTYRMLDTAERLLSAFSAAEQLKVVQALVLMFVAAPAILRYLFRLRAEKVDTTTFSAGWGKR